MKVTIKQIVGWDVAKTCALATIGKRAVNPFPTDKWKAEMLLAGHSPIRAVQYLITLQDIPYFVAMHLVRHKHGVEWFCNTSREDRTGVPREERRQTDLVTLTCIANAQALINISKKRLCCMADVKTRWVWRGVKANMALVDSVMAEKMQPECAWSNGVCRELQPCGYHRTQSCRDNIETLNKV